VNCGDGRCDSDEKDCAWPSDSIGCIEVTGGNHCSIDCGNCVDFSNQNDCEN